MSSHAFIAICWTLVPEEFWHCPWGNKMQAPCLLVGPRWPGLRPQGPAWLGPKTGLWWQCGRALPVPQIYERWRRWYKTNPGLLIFGRSSGRQKSAPSADSDGWLTSHFEHITDLIRDKWSGAKSSRCLCRLVWQAWLLHCSIFLWYSHHFGRTRLNSHTTCTFSPEKWGLFLICLKNNTVVFESSRAFWCWCTELFLNHTWFTLSSFQQQTKAWVELLRFLISTISIVWVQQTFKCLIEGLSWPRFSLIDDASALSCSVSALCSILRSLPNTKGQALAKNSYKSIH